MKFDKPLKVALTILILGVFVSLLLLIKELRYTNNINKANLTYSIYKEKVSWQTQHPAAYKWFSTLDTLLTPFYHDWEIDDYLGIYEMLYALQQKDMIDEDIMYELFSYELIAIYEANNFELKKMIERYRK